MELIDPSPGYKESFIAAVKEFKADDDYTYRSQWYKGLSLSELEADFEAYVEKEKSHARGENLPDGYVPASEYWLVDSGQYIGKASLRHRLNDHLMQIGGHIGYDIRPSKRGHGFGNIILELTLEKAKAMGIENVLVTCDERNIRSKKIIEKHGGVFENRTFNPELGFDMLRYWIQIA